MLRPGRAAPEDHPLQVGRAISGGRLVVMALDVHRIEQSLARNARQYLHTRNSELETALASDLEWLLEYHWHAQGHLKWCWFDGLVEWSFRVRKSHRLDVRGAMVWAETGNNTRQWI